MLCVLRGECFHIDSYESMNFQLKFICTIHTCTRLVGITVKSVGEKGRKCTEINLTWCYGVGGEDLVGMATGRRVRN